MSELTSAVKAMVKFLINNGGCDNCKACVHLNKNTCCVFNPDTQEYNPDKSTDDDYCIEGMVKYFEQQQADKK